MVGKKFWVFILEDGESWQTFGTLQEALGLFQENGHNLEEVVAIVSH